MLPLYRDPLHAYLRHEHHGFLSTLGKINAGVAMVGGIVGGVTRIAETVKYGLDVIKGKVPPRPRPYFDYFAWRPYGWNRMPWSYIGRINRFDYLLGHHPHARLMLPHTPHRGRF